MMEVERFWWDFNAYTSDEYAGYYVKCPPKHLSTAIDVLWDMMVYARFPAKEVEKEKGVVLQEIAMYEDDPQRQVMTKWREWYYGDTSYWRPVIWTKENVQSFTQEDLFEHKNSLYTKDNLVIVVSGNIPDKKLLINQLGEVFSELPHNKTLKKPPYTQHYPQEKESFFTKDTQQSHLVMSAPWFTSNDPRKYAANILGLIFAGNFSSRLFQEVREKEGLCYYIWWGHSSDTFDGCFYFRAWMDKDRFDFAKNRIYEEADRIAQWDISQKEFDNALGYKIWWLQMWLETTDGIASFIWSQELLYGKIETLEEKIAHYEKLTLVDVNWLAHMLRSELLYSYWIA